ncbi:MAG: DUF2254 domain-containing protein [Planctomycetales bacterium]|nr:DUF2254 domain-containing protein [Planctomycetales bacterium]
MSANLLFWWDELREKMWFIPSVYCVAAIVVAFVVLSIDREFEIGSDAFLPFLQTTGGSGRIVLGSLIGALVTVLGLVFSLTMLSVSQTASQYGPRLIRSVFDSNIAQNTIGFILSTVVFCMIVLRSIRDLKDSGSLFTPHLSILTAELASAACIFVLLAFTNHVTRCMRAETLIQSIYNDLIRAAEDLFPAVAEIRDADGIELSNVSAWSDLVNAKSLTSGQSGYLQAIQLQGVVACASERGHRLEISHRAGDFIHAGEVIARVQLSQDEAEGTKDSLENYQSFFLIGTVRTLRQDIEAGVLELVEAGVRALSPGVNDPITAINVIDYVSSFMRDLAGRQWPNPILVDGDGIPVLRVNVTDFRGVLNAGFDQLRQYAGNSVAVNCRLLEGLAAIAISSTQPEDRAAIKRQADMIVRAADRNIFEPEDKRDIRARAEQVDKAIRRSEHQSTQDTTEREQS